MAISPQRLTIYLYSAHRAVIFAIAQLSCIIKNNAVRYRLLRWEKFQEIVIKMLRVEKLELTPHSERICGLKLVQIEPRSTHQKRGLRWIANWHFYSSSSYVRLSLKIPSQYWDVHVRIHVAPLACYPFINIKLASYHLLLYVVYLCQKS